MEGGSALGESLRSTRGPTLGWGSVLPEPGGTAELLLGEAVLGAALVGLEVLMVRVVLSLAGLLCAVLKLSLTELAAVEGSIFTTRGVVSVTEGLCSR